MSIAYGDRPPSKRFLAFLRTQARRTQRLEIRWEQTHQKHEQEQREINGKLLKLEIEKATAAAKKTKQSQIMANSAAAYVYRLTLHKLAIEKRKPFRPILKALRSRLRTALRRVKAKKCAATSKLLGCNLTKFKSYIEAKFKPGMTWDNHGFLWHIDHIRPCCSFDLSKAKNQRKCFNYRNLQPLFVEENLKKGGRYQMSGE
jgi:hypothetical protein